MLASQYGSGSVRDPDSENWVEQLRTLGIDPRALAPMPVPLPNTIRYQARKKTSIKIALPCPVHFQKVLSPGKHLSTPHCRGFPGPQIKFTVELQV